MEVEAQADLTDPLVVAIAWLLTRLAAEGVRGFAPGLVALLLRRAPRLDGAWLDARLPDEHRPYIPVLAASVAGLARVLADLAQAGSLDASTVARAVAAAGCTLATQVLWRVPAKAAEAQAVARAIAPLTGGPAPRQHDP